MSLSVPEYWDQQVAALRKRSVEVEGTQEPNRFLAGVFVDDSNQSVGFIDARIWFDDNAYLDVFEYLEIDDADVPHRRKYSYHLEVDGREVERHDYDPKITVATLQHHVNRNLEGEVLHIPEERISLVQLVEICWGLIAEARGQIEGG